MANFYLFTLLTVFFIASGVILPYINQDFGQAYWDVGAEDELSGHLEDAEGKTSAVGIMGVMWGVFRMFLYLGSGTPLLFELLVLYPLRILWIFVFVDVLPFT